MAALSIAGIKHRWQDARRRWSSTSKSGWDPDTSVRGLTWKTDHGSRTLLFNVWAPPVKSNVDMCLVNLAPNQLNTTGFAQPSSYIALGELKGGIDPAGADEHWKTARTALNRIRDAFADTDSSPYTFFVGAAIEKRMANEIWRDLASGELSNAANLNETNQIASISGWLASL